MRSSLLFPVLAMALACEDGTPVQPVLDANPGISPILAEAPGGEPSTMVPFKSAGTWWGTPDDATDAEVAECAEVGGGVDVGAGVMNVTHLGRSDYRFLNCWGEAGLIYQVGRITAANGDELYYFGPGEEGWEVFDVDWEAGTYRIGLVRFTGGTGRFEGVKGSFMTFGDAFYGDEGWYGTEFWEGVISTVGSGK